MRQDLKKKRNASYIVLAVLAIPIGFFLIKFMADPLITTLFVGPGIAHEFIDKGVAGDIEGMQAMLTEDNKKQWTAAKLKTEVVDRLVGYESLDMGRKSSFGTTRKGDDVTSVNGYIKYKGRSEERTFSVSLIRLEGKWWINSVSIGSTLS